MAEHRRDPARLRDLLGDVGARFGLAHAVATGGLWSRWDEIVGERIASHAQPTSLRDGVLRIKVESPAWANELSYFAPEIIRKANEAAGSDIVREVKVWTGPGGVQRRSGGSRDSASSPRGNEPPGWASASPDRSEKTPDKALEAARAAWARARSGGSREEP